MLRSIRHVVALMAAMAVLAVAPSPAAAAPADPTTVEELRASVAYRSDHADVLRLYRAFFDREPDVEGASYWMSQYDEGAGLDDLAWGFANSQEFIDAYGPTLSNPDFLTIVYGNVLDRTPDAEGFEYWLGQMDGGLGQHGVVRWVAANDEFKTRHPYADGRADLASILLSAGDLPGRWADRDLVRNSGLAVCFDFLFFPELYDGVSFGTEFGEQLTHTVYAYPTTDQAADFMAGVRAGQARCASFTIGTTQYQTSALSLTPVGDDVFGVRFTISGPGSAPFDVDYIFVRYGSALTMVAYADTANVTTTFPIESIVTEAAQRMITLVGQ